MFYYSTDRIINTLQALLNRIYFVLKNKMDYVPGVVK